MFPVENLCPSIRFFNNCCEKLNLKFNRQIYIQFLQRIEIEKIRQNSIPSGPSRNGFESLSILFTGNLEIGKTIQQKINDYFYDNLGNCFFLYLNF